MNYTIMEKKFLLIILFLTTLTCQAIFAQTPQGLNKYPIPNSKNSTYVPALPFMLQYSAEKSLMILPRFKSDKATDSLAGIIGFDFFAKGMGKCFQHDTLAMTFENGKKLIIRTVNPEICDQPNSGWSVLSNEDLTTLFSGKLQQILYTNGKTQETIIQDITTPADKEYFLVLKKVYDTMAMKGKSS